MREEMPHIGACQGRRQRQRTFEPGPQFGVGRLGVDRHRRRPQSLPDAARFRSFVARPTSQPQAFVRFCKRHRHTAARFGRVFFRLGETLLAPRGACGTQIFERARAARGFASSAKHCPQIHQALRVVGHIGFGGQNLQALRLHRPFEGGRTDRSLDRIDAGHHPFGIAVRHCAALAARKSTHGRSRAFADPGQRHQIVEPFGHHAVETLEHLAGGPSKVAPATVVAESRPVAKDFVFVGPCQIVHRREALHEALEIGDHRGYLRLLQHDFRHPALVRPVRPLPRQIVPTVDALPGRQSFGKDGVDR